MIKTYYPDQIVSRLRDLSKEITYKKGAKPTFNQDEFDFIKDLIFNKPRDLVVKHLANEIIGNRFYLNHMPGIHSGASLRLAVFYYHYLLFRGNATQAAIAAGYSPKTAKQAGHRALRRMQRYSQMN